MQAGRCTIANLSSIGKEGQRKLSRACVGIVGLGGVGGIAFALLLRAGVGRIKIADGGFFEESNSNRQLLWSRKNDGKKKTAAALELAEEMGAGCKIEAFGEITESNSSAFASGCAAVIDATDSPRSRLAVWSGCKKEKVPYVFASALGTMGMLSVFRGKDFEREFAVRKGKRFLPCDHSLGPVANIVGCMAAQQAINMALGKPPIIFPRVFSFDAFSPEQARIHEF